MVKFQGKDTVREHYSRPVLLRTFGTKFKFKREYGEKVVKKCGEVVEN